MTDYRCDQALELMSRFAERTGATGQGVGRRYLWTDAFAVCNWLGLARATGDARHAERAIALVDRVHDTLGRDRAHASRLGDATTDHPTRGGLRIGKLLPERRLGEPMDDRLEWDQDGQYFHYLTRWMHALDQVSRSNGDPRYTRWARELMVTAHRAFVYERGGAVRMYWKMSIDLARPQVTSMGHHDALDGLVTCLQLEASAARFGDDASALARPRADFAAMVDRRGLATNDLLGIGGLLLDAYRVEQLGVDAGLRADLLEAGYLGLRHHDGDELDAPPSRRLAFRELGLAIGLAAAARAQRDPIAERVLRHDVMRSRIEAFWLIPDHRATGTWLEHSDIDDVMLATTLAPDGLIELREAS
jgi:hypothetical protein